MKEDWRFDFVGMVKKADMENKEADLVRGTIKYRFLKGQATQVLVVGARGTGKSSVCYRLSELYNKDIYYQDSSKDDDDDDDLGMESSSETKKLRKPRYIEWQSIRRLGLNDVKGVFIPINELANIPQHILDKLEQMGIKITVVGAK
jgi:polynucleotide 5'-kinase involved in rRNA processing